MTSCQSAKELHYFKSGDNYYRLRINSYSIASRSRYISGYFDEHAVEKYFSEMGQPDSAQTVNWANHSPNAKLIMILSSNSNSISEQIGNFANNEEILEVIARLANKEKIDKAIDVSNQIDEIDLLKDKIKTTAAMYLDSLSKSPNPKSDLKDFLLTLEIRTDGKLSVRNLELAKTKFEN
ncbi:MAG: hypothetical protein JNJ40_18180 [Bacteroidia bacterium]|nr:hypothetical protein [Bacteroidia bacterium]